MRDLLRERERSEGSWDERGKRWIDVRRETQRGKERERERERVDEGGSGGEKRKRAKRTSLCDEMSYFFPRSLKSAYPSPVSDVIHGKFPTDFAAQACRESLVLGQNVSGKMRFVAWLKGHVVQRH